MHPGMRRDFFRRMLNEMGGPGRRDHAWHGGWPSWQIDCGEHITDEQRLAHLEEYQRDLEQQVADVATEIKRLRAEMAAAPASSGDDA